MRAESPAKLIRARQPCVVLGGAGVSTEAAASEVLERVVAAV